MQSSIERAPVTLDLKPSRDLNVSDGSRCVEPVPGSARSRVKPELLARPAIGLA